MRQTAPTYHLVRRPARTSDPPCLDGRQQAVADHSGGPLLVLAGPGTGKTTTIVEAVVDRIERRGLDPEQILVLTFSRKAAAELRERVSARLRRTTREPLAMTFHSYAYALLRREAVLAGEPAPRLLSGPEQLLEVRRLISGEIEDGARQWPEHLRPALSTRGFARELRDLLLRTRERGLDGATLAALGREHRRDDWVAAGHFLRRYTSRFAVDPVPSYDYAELVYAAVALLERDDVRRRERASRPVVFVDEYQDTDPAQERLLQLLAGDGHELVVVGDPDQSIYGFRGAEVRGILEFPRRFPAAPGTPAPIIALRTCRRSGPDLLESSRRVARRLPAVPGGEEHRALRPVETRRPSPETADGAAAGVGDSAADDGKPRADEPRVTTHLAGSASEEAALVADTLRRAHLLDGVPWSRMAVLVRSAVRQLPVLRRALSAAGVPAVVAGDEIPLADQPSVKPLLAVLRHALRPDLLDRAAAEDLLTGPLGRADALGLRRLARALREVERQVGGKRSDGALLVEAVSDPRQLALVAADVAGPAARVGKVLAAARGRVASGGNAEDILWAAWSASGLAERWSDVSLAGGQRGAGADRDLDAVLALFDAAARFADQTSRGGPGVFLDNLTGQEIPADSLAEQAPKDDAVRLLTAHRSKGLEWDVVVVAGVQEGVWPDLRLRGSMLGAEDLVQLSGAGDASPAAVTSKLLDEERRLFYVAVTRARRRLVVTAVDADDAAPSRFLTELVPSASPGAHAVVAGTPFRWLSLPALVADLRSVVTDPGQPDELRRKAAAHLARLAERGVRGAHPREWHALTPVSDDRPLVPPEGSVTVSPSQVERFQACPLRWLLETAVGARRSQTTQHLGSVIHALAALAAAEGTLDVASLARRLDEVWEELDFGSAWFARKQRDTAERMLERFVAWHKQNPRELLAVEAAFEARTGRVRINGRVDRIERDDLGRAVVVDLKTGTAKPGDGELPQHPQLGVYQLAVKLRGFEELGFDVPGGAELVQLGKAAFARTARTQRQDALPERQEPDWAETLVGETADGMSAAVFLATINDGCRTCPVRSCCPLHDEGEQVTG